MVRLHRASGQGRSQQWQRPWGMRARSAWALRGASWVSPRAGSVPNGKGFLEADPGLALAPWRLGAMVELGGSVAVGRDAPATHPATSWRCALQLPTVSRPARTDSISLHDEMAVLTQHLNGRESPGRESPLTNGAPMTRRRAA